MSCFSFTRLSNLLLKKECFLDHSILSCYASTGRKGNTKNANRSNRNRQRGWKVQDGDTIHRGFLLARQIHRYRWLPGANVVCNRNRALIAACAGTVRFTKEIFIPKKGEELADTVLRFPRGALLYKTTINVIPPLNSEGQFRFVESI